MSEIEQGKDINNEGSKIIANETICPSCQLAQPIGNKICDKCGKNISPEKMNAKLKKRKKSKSSFEQRERSANGAKINDGRIMILVVSVITFCLYLFNLHIINLLLLALQSKAEFLAEEADQTLFKLLNLIPVGLGIMYLGLFFWSFKNIYGALLITLIIYLLETSLVLAVSELPNALTLILKAVIIFFLALSIKTCMKANDKAEESAN